MLTHYLLSRRPICPLFWTTDIQLPLCCSLLFSTSTLHTFWKLHLTCRNHKHVDTNQGQKMNHCCGWRGAIDTLQCLVQSAAHALGQGYSASLEVIIPDGSIMNTFLAFDTHIWTSQNSPALSHQIDVALKYC